MSLRRWSPQDPETGQWHFELRLHQRGRFGLALYRLHQPDVVKGSRVPTFVIRHGAALAGNALGTICDQKGKGNDVPS